MNPFATPERNRWSAGQALGADDLSREQDYHRAATARTAWAAMGAGVVAGLEVTVDGNGDVSVGPGLAIDALGREIVVPSGAGLSPVPEPPFTVWIAHADVPGRQIPGPDGPEASTVREEWTLVAVAGVSAAPAGAPPGDVADLVRAGDVAGALALVAAHRPPPSAAAGVPLGSVVRDTAGAPVLDTCSRLTAVTAASLLPLIAALAEIVRERPR